MTTLIGAGLQIAATILLGIQDACFVLNGVIFLGSYFMVRQVLSPMVYSLLSNNTSDTLNKAGEIMGYTISWMYELLWIYPIYCISFVLNAVWYQDIAENAFVLRGGQSTIKSFHWKRWFAAMSEQLYSIVLTLIFLVQTTLISFVPLVGRPLALLHLCWLYAMYSFEYRWHLEGWKLEARLLYFERRWAYFAGFGFPSAILTVLFPSIFVSSGLFALIFPFLIILAIVAKPKTHFRRTAAAPVEDRELNGVSHDDANVNPGRLPIFYYAKRVNSAFFRCVHGSTSGGENKTN